MSMNNKNQRFLNFQTSNRKFGNKKIFLLLAGILLVFLAVSFVISQSFKEYVLLEFKYDNGELILINKSLEKGYAPSLSHDAARDYSLNLISEEKILYSTSFNPSILYSDSFIEEREEMQGGALELKETEFFVAVPSVKEAEKVEILKDGKKIFEEEIYDVGASSCRIK